MAGEPVDVQLRVKAQVNTDDLLSEVMVGGTEGKRQHQSKFLCLKMYENM